jgi:hypothetical protein
MVQEKADQVMTENTELLPDSAEVLSRLKSKGIRTGIVTSKYHYRISEILSKRSIRHLVDIIVGREDVTHAKPHPEALVTAMEKLARIGRTLCMSVTARLTRKQRKAPMSVSSLLRRGRRRKKNFRIFRTRRLSVRCRSSWSLWEPPNGKTPSERMLNYSTGGAMSRKRTSWFFSRI